MDEKIRKILLHNEQHMKQYEMFRNQTVFITGATGLIGNAAIKMFMDMNEMYQINVHVVAMARNLGKVKACFKPYMDHAWFSYYIGDVNQPIDYDGEIDYIIHGAGVTGGSKKHIEYPVRTIQTAYIGTTHLLELGREKCVKGFVYLSSLEVYGKMDMADVRIKEQDQGYLDCTNIRSSYSESKRMCECLCASYASQYEVPVRIARLTATFGPGVQYEDGRVFAQFARSIINKENIVLKSTGETVRNYCDVRDAVSGIMTLLVGGVSGEAYNIANESTGISIKEMAKLFVTLYQETGAKVIFDLAEDITKLGYNQTVKVQLNSKKLQQLGWQPCVPFEDTIVDLVESMRNQNEYR